MVNAAANQFTHNRSTTIDTTFKLTPKIIAAGPDTRFAATGLLLVLVINKSMSRSQ